MRPTFTLRDGQCNASFIRRALVKLLRLSSYDVVCTSKWQSSSKVPRDDHEYIDVLVNGNTEGSDRSIIDIDFRRNFEIAQVVESYDVIFNSLPVVCFGSQHRLEQFLKVIVDAAKCSLKQNFMPLSPWRSLSYLQAKRHSKYERKHNTDGQHIPDSSSDCRQCIEPLRRLKASLQF